MAAIVLPSRSRFAIARREPNLLVPGRKPTAFRIRESLRDCSDAKILTALIRPGFDSVNNAPFSGNWSDSNGNTLLNNAVIQQPGGSTDNASRCRIWFFKINRATTGNYYPYIYNGSAPWNGAYTMHGVYGSTYVYAGTQGYDSGRIEPGDMSGPLFSSSGSAVGCLWFSNHTPGTYYGARLYKDGVLLVHKAFASGIAPLSTQQPIWIGTGDVLEIEYFVEVSVPDSFFAGTATDAAATEFVRRVQTDIYNYVTEPANQSPFLISIPGGGGAETINADFISSVTSVYEPTLTTGAVTISVDFVSAATSVYEPTVSAPSGTQDVTADFISSATSVYEPTVTTGAVTVTADFIAASTSVHESTLTVGAVTITADFVSAATSVYEPTVFSGSAIIPDFIAAATSVYEPTVTTGAVTIAADLIAAGTIVYEPSVSSAVNISADFIAAATSVHEAIVGVGAVTILADFISSGTIVYEPSIPFGQIISADFIAALSAVYEPSVTDAATIWTEITPVSTIWTEI